MAVEVFEWCPYAESTSSVGFRVMKTEFGDGYTQVAQDGINTRNSRHNMSVRGNLGTIKDVMAFFDRHSGWKAFEYTHPVTGLGLFRCEGYSPEPLGGTLWSINFALIPFNRS